LIRYVLAKLPDHPAKNIDELLDWRWKLMQPPRRVSRRSKDAPTPEWWNFAMPTAGRKLQQP
jgi:hypothetical protein